MHGWLLFTRMSAVKAILQFGVMRQDKGIVICLESISSRMAHQFVCLDIISSTMAHQFICFEIVSSEMVHQFICLEIVSSNVLHQFICFEIVSSTPFWWNDFHANKSPPWNDFKLHCTSCCFLHPCVQTKKPLQGAPTALFLAPWDYQNHPTPRDGCHFPKVEGACLPTGQCSISNEFPHQSNGRLHSCTRDYLKILTCLFASCWLLVVIFQNTSRLIL